MTQAKMLLLVPPSPSCSSHPNFLTGVSEGRRPYPGLSRTPAPEDLYQRSRRQLNIFHSCCRMFVIIHQDNSPQYSLYFLIWNSLAYNALLQISPFLFKISNSSEMHCFTPPQSNLLCKYRKISLRFSPDPQFCRLRMYTKCIMNVCFPPC